MMEYDVFKEVVEEKIKGYLPESFKDYEIRFESVNKLNAKKDSISLIEPGKGMKVSPTLYINDMYNDYKNIDSLETVLIKSATLLSDKSGVKIDFPDFSFDNAKDNIVMMLINSEQNRDMLDNVMHREFEDLSIIYKWVVEKNENGMMSATITNSIAENWGVTEEQLFALASENTKRINPPLVMSLADMMIATMIEQGAPQEAIDSIREETGLNPMWVVTNESKLNGAVSVLVDETLTKLAEKMGTDLYVLPSSIHETLVVSADGKNLQALADMVYEVNMTQVSLEDRLSNEVYFYDNDLKKLSLATDSPHKRLDGAMEESMNYNEDRSR